MRCEVYRKYNNKKIVTADGTFDSKKEYGRWCDLKWMQRAGQITNLQRQVKFELIPSQKVDGKVVERPCSYIADFVYEQDGKQVVEDAKGMKTDTYILKRKLMLERYGIQIKEV